ncbi:MAG: DUF2294 domain-containing protein [Phycisphaerales bacterium]|nr:MAG: DUF2294 domain-containing protein [Phycisphaerales bacterium]
MFENNPPSAVNTQGEIEASICEGMRRFHVEYMGRGPKQVTATLIGVLVVIRLEGVMTAAERQLVKSLPHDRGRDLLKEVRTKLIESARPTLEAMILDAAGVSALSLHHDISTTTGEEIVVFTLSELPAVREKR